MLALPAVVLLFVGLFQADYAQKLCLPVAHFIVDWEYALHDPTALDDVCFCVSNICCFCFSGLLSSEGSVCVRLVVFCP